MDIEEQYDKIFHYCYYRIRDKNVAEDITQKVVLRFYNSNYVEQQKEIRYLYTIARNLCIDEYRKRNIYGRMVSVGNKMFEAVPLSLTIYFSLSVLALTLCAIIAFLRKCDRK